MSMIVQGSSFAYPEGWLRDWLVGDNWDWGDGREHKTLTDERALSYAPIWYGVSKIAGHVAQLPLKVYKRLDRGAELVRDHNISKLIRRPNKYQTSVVFREQVATYSLLDGNGAAAIVRRGSKPVELLPLHPDRLVTVMFEGEKIHGYKPDENDRVKLFFNPPEPTQSDPWYLFDDSEVLHIPGLSLNGVAGVSLRKMMSRNVGASIDAEERYSKQMQKGFSGNLVIEVPSGMLRNEKDAEEFIAAWKKKHHDPNKAGEPALLREGMKANVISLTNKDAEMIENRRFQRQDAALYLGLESILGDDNSVSYNSLEQKNLAYLMNCLNRWLVRWEQEVEYKLLSKREFDNETHFVRFNTAALLKSDFQTTVSSLSTLVTGTILSRNEAREVLDRNPVEGGDEFENPAITPGRSSTGMEDDSPDDSPEPSARRAINSRLGHFIGGECSKVISAAQQAVEKGKNFLAWVDDFYSDKWLPKMADLLDEIGLDRDLAAAYCKDSKQRLLEITDYSTPENLASNVEKCVSTWKNRANSIGVES